MQALDTQSGDLGVIFLGELRNGGESVIMADWVLGWCVLLGEVGILFWMAERNRGWVGLLSYVSLIDGCFC